MASPKTDEDEQFEIMYEQCIQRVRERVRALIDERFDGNVSAAHRAWGISQAALNDLKINKRGIGLKLIIKVAARANVTIDELLFGPRASASGPAVGAHPAWETSEKTAKVEHPGIPAWAWEMARGVGGLPASPTPQLATDLAALVLTYTPPEERERREREAAAPAIGRLRALRGTLPGGGKGQA